MDLLKSIGVTGVAVLVAFYLVRDVLGPLVKMARRQKPSTSMPDKVAVLEINLSTLTTRVDDFKALLEHQNEAVDTLGRAVDNKLDIVLQEFQEMRDDFAKAHVSLTERIAKAETHIEHLLRTRAARGQV